MTKKDFCIILLKGLIYVCTLVLAVLGVSAVTSCTIQRESLISGKAVIVTNDTTYINHSGTIHFPKK